MKREYIVEVPWEPDQRAAEECGFQELIRCKDCCMGEPYPREAGKTWCHLMSEPHKDDWYCADAERKDGEQDG